MKCKCNHCFSDTKQSPWWNIDCDKAKNAKYQALRTFRQTNTEDDLDRYFIAGNRFKAITCHSKDEYHRQNRQQLVESRNIPNIFWKTLKWGADKKSCEVTSCSISGTEWYTYFKGLLTSTQRDEQDQPPILDNDCDMKFLKV